MGKDERSDLRSRGQSRFPAACAIALGVLLLCSGSSVGAVKPGDKISQLSAKTIEGEEVTIDFSGESSPVILTFWSIYCKSCSEELEKVQALVAKYGPEAVRVYAVNEDYDLKRERVSRFLSDLEKRIGKKNFTVLYDEEARIFKTFSLVHMPTLIYIDKDGEVREIIEGFDRGRQRAVISALSKLIEEVTPDRLKEVEGEKYYEVSIRVPVCGIYREGKWVRPVDDSREDRAKSLERATSVAEYLAGREALRMALEDVGVNVSTVNKEPSCVNTFGIEPEMYLGGKDALDLFGETFNTRHFIGREESKNRAEGRFIWTFSVYKANLRKLRDRVMEKGYSPRPSTYVLKFVNADFFNHTEFAEKLPRQIPLVGSLKTVSRDGQIIEDELRCHIADVESLTLALEGLNLERERISAISLGGNVIEIQFLR